MGERLHSNASSDLSVVLRCAYSRSIHEIDSIGVLFALIEIVLDHRGADLLVLFVSSVCNSRRTNPVDCADEHSSRLIEFRDSPTPKYIGKCNCLKITTENFIVEQF